MENHEAVVVNGSAWKMGAVVLVRVVKFYFPPTRLFLHIARHSGLRNFKSNLSILTRVNVFIVSTSESVTVHVTRS